MPAESDLPPSLQPITRLNALRLRDDDWEADLQRLSKSLSLQPKLWRHRWVWALAAVLLTAGVVGSFWVQQVTDDGSPTLVDASPPRIASRDEAVSLLARDQYAAMNQLKTDPARAAQMFTDNFAAVDRWLAQHPRDVELLALAGYAAKNVYAQTEEQLLPKIRAEYLARAERMFQQALQLSPQDASALNGMGNVRYYQGNLDAAIELHNRALKLVPDYPAARQDLEFAQKRKRETRSQGTK